MTDVPMRRQYRLYYRLKPFLMRSAQVAVRRSLVRHQLAKVRDTWPINPKAGGEPTGWAGWPDGRRFALVVTHDVEGVRGVRRCSRLMEMEQDLGLVSSFNFVPERYELPSGVRDGLTASGFEVGVHDLRHDGRLFESEGAFLRRVAAVNDYLKAWDAVGFRAGSMYHNLEWMHRMRIDYDSSTFDTDPFEPQPDGAGTVFPFWVANPRGEGGYVELPYTLPQDMTVFVLLQERDCSIWGSKLAWIAERGGMALIVTHPDYMYWEGERPRVDEYPATLYREFLREALERYRGQYWSALPRDVARFWRDSLRPKIDPPA